ncbi:hypothetical protein [Pseudomonas piscis]|uniref:hypothetical protein n=1 Tax=Pseudomonas piscis TaxID=2614538 RepID=UPI0021D5FEF4|nr:hypothetical protein [Pseudomonas piscis]MCU7650102.1 hypothetical protein [Pseudomonas piscis]
MKFNFSNFFTVASILFSLFAFFSFYPGAMTWDSLDQLRQARMADYSDWQPPVMAFVWAGLLNVADGPGVMLCFHLLLLWSTALFLFKWTLEEGYKHGFLFLLIPALPWVLNFEFVIWKDVGMAYSWGAAIALCLCYKSRERFPLSVAFIVLALFVYGMLVRSNSLGAAFFLFPFLAGQIFKKKSVKHILAFMMVAIFGFFVITFLVNSAIGAKKSNSVSYVMFDDVVALKLRGVDVSLDFLTQDEISTIASCEYLNENKVGAAFCIDGDRFKEITINNYQELKLSWVNSVFDNYPTYVAYRLSAFSQLVRSPWQSVYYESEFRVVKPPYELDSGIRSESAQEKFFRKYVVGFKKLFPGLFKPYVWMVLLTCIAFLFWFDSAFKGTLFWLLPVSGLSYVLTYIPITPAGDFRYVYWSCFVCTISIFSYINGRARASKVS